MSATHYDAALAWLQVAADAVARARAIIRVGAWQAEDRMRAVRGAEKADRELKAQLEDIVDDMTRVRFAKLVHERLRREREPKQKGRAA